MAASTIDDTGRNWKTNLVSRLTRSNVNSKTTKTTTQTAYRKNSIQMMSLQTTQTANIMGRNRYQIRVSYGWVNCIAMAEHSSGLYSWSSFSEWSTSLSCSERYCVELYVLSSRFQYVVERMFSAVVLIVCDPYFDTRQDHLLTSINSALKHNVHIFHSLFSRLLLCRNSETTYCTTKYCHGQ